MIKTSDLINHIKIFCCITGIEDKKVIEELINIMNYRIKNFLIPTNSFFSEIIQHPNNEIIKIIPERLRPNKKFHRKSLDDKEKCQVLKKAKYRCEICGKYFITNDFYHFDHKIPITKNGSNKVSNFQVLCFDCNLGKGNFENLIVSAPWRADISEKRLKVAVLQRDKYCVVCCSSAKQSQLDIRRIVPIERGGRWIYDNLETICYNCINRK